MNWMIYGANGYTGELIAREAVKRGQKPILAGRSKGKIEPLAKELGLEARAFSLSDADAASQLNGCQLVMHCAGPFSATAKPMMEACLKVGAHYLDITGEIAVFELGQTFNDRAGEAGIVICPGVGFDVIPTDCVALALKQAMPDATHLTLGFDSKSGMSPGTAKTNIEGLAKGGKVRRAGKIVDVPFAHSSRRIDFGDGERLAMPIPWGDVSTAFHTTGIPNIEVYIPASRGMLFGAKVSNYFRWLLRREGLQSWLKKRMEKKVTGPGEETRAGLPTHVWGEVRNAKGDVKTARVSTENVYSVTITGALAVIDYLLNNQPEGGAYTPAKLVGAQLVSELPGSSAITIQ